MYICIQWTWFIALVYLCICDPTYTTNTHTKYKQHHTHTHTQHTHTPSTPRPTHYLPITKQKMHCRYSRHEGQAHPPPPNTHNQPADSHDEEATLPDAEVLPREAEGPHTPPRGGVDLLPRGAPQEGGGRRNHPPAAVPKVAFRGADHRAEAAYRVGGVPRDDQGGARPMGGGLRLAGEPREVVARPKVEVRLSFFFWWFALQMR